MTLAASSFLGWTARRLFFYYNKCVLFPIQDISHDLASIVIGFEADLGNEELALIQRSSGIRVWDVLRLFCKGIGAVAMSLKSRIVYACGKLMSMVLDQSQDEMSELLLFIL